MRDACRPRGFALLLSGLLFGQAGYAQDDGAPLSAIDWLSDSVETLPATAPLSLPVEDPVTESAAVPTVTVTPLDQPSPDRVGLLPFGSTGLPASLWQHSTVDDLVALVQAERVDALPAIQELLVTLMLAEAEPPAGAGPVGRLFLARVDKLLEIGALDPAYELLTTAVPERPDMFRRYFDVALLTGREDQACRTMTRKPEVAPTLTARIFCLARAGDWSAAALTLNTAVALGDVDADTEALLSRFLDPELFEGEPPLSQPERVTPLDFRMRNAIGEGLSTATLPRAFAHADLRDTVGWKAQLDAAERLTRAGAIPPGQLMALYDLQRPAASGSVWDRARAMQDLGKTLDEDGTASDAALQAAWEAAQAARIEVSFAKHIGADLQTGDATGLVLRVGLLTQDYESFANAAAPADRAERFLVALAQGQPGDEVAEGRLEDAIVAGFGDGTPDPMLMAMAEEGRLGEALLRAIAAFNAGRAGDLREVTETLSLFRALGLEDLARRAALQLLLLERSP